MEEQVRLLPVANVVSARLTDSQAEEDQKMQAMVSNAKKVSSRFLKGCFLARTQTRRRSELILTESETSYL